MSWGVQQWWRKTYQVERHADHSCRQFIGKSLNKNLSRWIWSVLCYKTFFSVASHWCWFQQLTKILLLIKQNVQNYIYIKSELSFVLSCDIMTSQVWLCRYRDSSQWVILQTYIIWSKYWIRKWLIQIYWDCCWVVTQYVYKCDIWIQCWNKRKQTEGLQ